MIDLQEHENNRKFADVYLCECKGEISNHVDLDIVSKILSQMPSVRSVKIHHAICSTEGRSWLKEDLKKCSPQRVLMGACSSDTAAFMFADEFEEAGLNKYLLEQIDLRELCAWVHPDKEEANRKAISIMKGGIYRALHLQPAEDLVFKIEPAALLIGGGRIGFRVALQIARAGIRVYVIEPKKELGSENPELNEVQSEKNIEFLFNTEIEKIDGIFGNRKIDLVTTGRRKELIVGTIIISPSRANFNECKRIAEMVHATIDIGQIKKMGRQFSASDNRGILVLPCNEDLKEGDILFEEAKSAVADLIKIMQDTHVRLPRIIASTDDFRCRGCGRCKEVCEYGAITLVKNDENGQIAQVDEERCEGCGACTFACCNGAMSISIYGADQLMANMLGELEVVRS